jgi:hypothetical protein
LRTWLNLSLECPLETTDEIHLEPVCVSDHIRVNYESPCQRLPFPGRVSVLVEHTEHLIGLPEAETQAILLHELPVLLCAFASHLDGGRARGWGSGGWGGGG